MNSQTTKIANKAPNQFIKMCNWFMVACGCLIFMIDALRWMRGEPHISLFAIGLMIGSSGNFVFIKQLQSPQQPWSLSAKVYFFAAETLSVTIIIIMLAHLCGSIRLPHIFH
jgi:hypothetical protein